MATKLVDAVSQVIAVTGYDGLTVRAVAKAAGVSAASAYNYFASKEHLLAEVYWRRLSALPPVEVGPRATAGDRMRAAVEPIVTSLAGEPELAAGVTTAMLAHDPDVVAVRDQVGALMAQRLHDALGPSVPDEASTPLVFMLTGGLLNAGMGYLEYPQVAEEMAKFADSMPWKKKRA
jgi:AcrR family transcriptional regulator